MSDIKDKVNQHNKNIKDGNVFNFTIPNPVTIEIEKFSDVKETKIDWLWKGKIAYGKITLFAGEPGIGKSQLLLYIASCVSNGTAFHFDLKTRIPQKVLIISGEDKAEDTIKPRLLALGANLENIYHVKGIKSVDKGGNQFFDYISLLDHIVEIETLIKDNKFSLIIVDPVSLYLGSVDIKDNQEIRRALTILGAMAERNNFALVLNSHFTKPSANVNVNAIYRIMGSIGFAATVRLLFGILRDPKVPENRLFLTIKNNISADNEGLVYQIKPVFVGNDIETSKIEWLSERTTQSANEILNQVSSPRLEEAKDLLLELLHGGGMALKDIHKNFTERGISKDRMYKAKNELNLLETDSIMNKRGKIWMLPA